ncbi:MAG: hypothetical protein J2P45_18035 [Candidatus Dormibacteraeota bacterium]|nr:hypothetical protein [Candidatus Dormibacteraeota bacterium]
MLLLLIVLLVGWLATPGPHSFNVNWSPHWEWTYQGTANHPIAIPLVPLFIGLSLAIGLVRARRDRFRSPEWGRVAGISTVLSLSWVVVAVVVDASPRGFASLLVLLPFGAELGLMALIVQLWGGPPAALPRVSSFLFVASLVAGALIGWVGLNDPFSLTLLIVPIVAVFALAVSRLAGRRNRGQLQYRPPPPAVPVGPPESTARVAGPTGRGSRVVGCGVFLPFIAFWVWVGWQTVGAISLLVLGGMAAFMLTAGTVSWWVRRRHAAPESQVVWLKR